MAGIIEKRKTILVCRLIILISVVGWVLFAGKLRLAERIDGVRVALSSSGSPQLISIEALRQAAPEGEMCQYTPASASATFEEMLQTQSGTGPTSSIDADRTPVRVIRDSYSTYSAVGVDVQSNEVYLQDENLFGMMVFDRMTNTPPTASFSEPKRRLRGSNTLMEFNCSLWVDPKNGDVYSVNNDMINTMVVFARGASGNVAPMRQLHTPHRAFGIAVDEAAQELYLTIQHPPKVVVFRKSAAGDEKPLRTLAGPQTRLKDAHGIAVDSKDAWMFVANHGAGVKPNGAGGEFNLPSITVYPLKASGDTAPIRTIQGPNTRLNWPALMYVDADHGDLYVANDMDDSVLVFRATDEGDVAPPRVIKGPKTGIQNPTGLYLDNKNDELWVSNMGNHTATVYPRTANGDVTPKRTIRSAPAGKSAQMIGNPGAVAYDSKRDEILVPN